MRLYHFSDDKEIGVFAPRPVAVPSPRPPGRDWLNGPLVWAIDAAHQPLYLFPRECPRILLWAVDGSSAADRARFMGDGAARMIAHIEHAWLSRLQEATLYRYALPAEPFRPLGDAGMWVSRQTVAPTRMDPISDLPAALAAEGVELRVLERLTTLKGLWSTSLHASGLRLRNARDWIDP